MTGWEKARLVRDLLPWPYPPPQGAECARRLSLSKGNLTRSLHGLLEILRRRRLGDHPEADEAAAGAGSLVVLLGECGSPVGNDADHVACVC